MHSLSRAGFICALLVLASPGWAFDSTSTGADGAVDSARISLLALDPMAPMGVDGRIFDPTAWGLPAGQRTFNFTTIDVPAGTAIRFGADLLGEGTPIMWLASGDVTISGTLDFSGEKGANGGPPSRASGGAGGYSGGMQAPPGTPSRDAGGPGAGLQYNQNGSGGAHLNNGVGTNAGKAYSNIYLRPVTGGSGGAGSSNDGGGGGGGAFLLASSGNVTIDGLIDARGGDGGDRGGGSSIVPGSGAGGGVRVMATALGGTGTIDVTRGFGVGVIQGSDGIIRLEADLNSFPTNNTVPTTSATRGRPGALFLPATAPKVTVTHVDFTPVSPSGGVTIDASTQVDVQLAATGVPVGTTIRVTLTPDGAQSTIQEITLDASMMATVQVTFPFGLSKITVSASW